MAEVLGMMVTGAHTARAPAQNTYKLLYTATQQGTISVHVCNTTAALALFQIAIIDAATAYVDGNTPPLYSFVHYDEEVDAKQSYDTVSFQVGTGDKIVVRTDTNGVTFLPTGILT